MLILGKFYLLHSHRSSEVDLFKRWCKGRNWISLSGHVRLQQYFNYEKHICIQ